jgi:hypothetical protein
MGRSEVANVSLHSNNEQIRQGRRCTGWRRETVTFEIIRKKNEGNLQNFI